jgi:endonuclease/exonuclease/phosphatase (EEP) superfamily protein YafD
MRGNKHNLKVFNLHALNFSRISQYQKQLAQINAAAKSHEGPMILAGDFNTWSIKRYRLLLQMTSELGLTEAKISRKSKARHLYRHLDHLFYRGLRLDRIEMVDAVTSSDHIPIIARLSTI